LPPAARRALIDVVPVQRRNDLGGRPVTHAICERHEVEVVARRIPDEAQPRLDPRDFGKSVRGAPPLDGDLFHLERAGADQIADPCLDTVRAAEDQHRALDACGHQPCVASSAESTSSNRWWNR
jgi:hypothetical protein